MKELTQIAQAVMQAFEAGGLKATETFPDCRQMETEQPLAAVRVRTAESKTMGFCNYLGQVWDAQAGTERELYGKQLDAVIAVDIRGRRAADCERGCEQAAEILLGGGLPSGIRAGELSWEGLTWERETERFLRRGKFRCAAVFTAQSREDGSAFLDFRLKGVLTR